MSYHHFSIQEREMMLILLTKKQFICQIARQIGRNKSSISREIARNGGRENYRPSTAMVRYTAVRQACKPRVKLLDPTMRTTIIDGLKVHWSPEQIVGRNRLAVAVPTIYRAIRHGVLPMAVKQQLRRKGRGYKRSEKRRGKLSGYRIMLP